MHNNNSYTWELNKSRPYKDKQNSATGNPLLFSKNYREHLSFTLNFYITFGISEKVFKDKNLDPTKLVSSTATITLLQLTCQGVPF